MLGLLLKPLFDHLVMLLGRRQLGETPKQILLLSDTVVTCDVVLDRVPIIQSLVAFTDQVH